jgi:hypothetical protein
VWACYDKGTHSFGFLSRTDKSDEFTHCERVDDIANVAKLAYYAVRLMKLLAEP